VPGDRTTYFTVNVKASPVIVTLNEVKDLELAAKDRNIIYIASLDSSLTLRTTASGGKVHDASILTVMLIYAIITKY